MCTRWLSKLFIVQRHCAFLWLHENFSHCILDRGRDSSSVLKIADFGVSKSLQLNPMRTCCGSPDYIAPEIITQKDGYDGKLADLWVRIFGVCVCHAHSLTFCPAASGTPVKLPVCITIVRTCCTHE